MILPTFHQQNFSDNVPIKIPKTRAFTLIELIVVIAIIGFLTTLAFTSFSGARIQSRDQKKISDLSEIQLALEQYFNKYGFYPVKTDDLSTGQYKFLAQVPTPPSIDASYNYVPLATPANPSICISYQLWTRLEGKNSTASSSKRGFDSKAVQPFSNGLISCDGNDYSFIDASADSIYDVMPQI